MKVYHLELYGQYLENIHCGILTCYVQEMSQPIVDKYLTEQLFCAKDSDQEIIE